MPVIEAVGLRRSYRTGLVLLDFSLPVAAVPALAATVTVTAVSCTAFGLTLGAIGLRARDVWVGSNLAYFLLLLLCGANMPPGQLPSWLAAVGGALPLTHGIDAARQLVAGAGLPEVAGLLGREGLIAAAYAALGYGLLRLFEVEGRRRATLETF